MTSFIWSSIGLYCVFSVFVFYQQLHAKNFRGGSQLFGLAIAISAFAGTLTGIVYLGYYGWNISWLPAFAAFVLGILSGLAGIVLEKIFGALVLSLAGFLVWPVCAYFMFKLLSLEGTPN